MEIRSGNAQVVAQGTVAQFDNNPIEVIFSVKGTKFKLVFKFVNTDKPDSAKIDFANGTGFDTETNLFIPGVVPSMEVIFYGFNNFVQIFKVPGTYTFLNLDDTKKLSITFIMFPPDVLGNHSFSYNIYFQE